MEKQARLTRSQVISRLRENAGRFGFVSFATLVEADKPVLRSLPLHFPGLPAAREIAGVPGPPYTKPLRKTGPKPGSPSRQPKRTPRWSRRTVLDELRALHEAGHSTRLYDLVAAGKASLVTAATKFLGGLRTARRRAGIPSDPRKAGARSGLSPEHILQIISKRSRAGESLAATRVPPTLYAAARRAFDNWANALSAAGIDPASARAPAKYTRQRIVEILTAAAERGGDLRYENVRRIVDMKAIHREFGTLAAAIRAAGLKEVLATRRHGTARWDRARVIAELRARAARGLYVMTPGLRRAAQLYAGGSYEARLAAGTLRAADKVRAANGAPTWTRERLLAAMRARARRGQHALTSSLYGAARRLFGGVQAARAAAGVPDPIDVRATDRVREQRAFRKRHARRVARKS